MRENELAYGQLGDFTSCGGYQKYCDLVGTCGVFVVGNGEVAATADFIGRYIIILGATEGHDVYIHAGHLGLGAPMDLGLEEDAIAVAHWRDARHYTSAVICYRPWSTPRNQRAPASRSWRQSTPARQPHWCMRSHL